MLSNCTHLTNFMSLFNLTLVVDEPTHFSNGGSPSLLDLIFTSVPETTKCTVVPPLGSSDHRGLYIECSRCDKQMPKRA